MTEQLPKRRTIRLINYDYSQDGLYFVTVCCQDKICRFGKVEDGVMVLNDAGKIAKQCWLDMPVHFPHIILHEFIIMPNHIHGIIEISHFVGAKNLSPEYETLFQSPSKTIGSIIRGFKIGVTKWFNNNRAKDFSPLQKSKPIWQRNYYEHIIRNEQSHQQITDYIINNPFNWGNDKYYNQ